MLDLEHFHDNVWFDMNRT